MTTKLDSIRLKNLFDAIEKAASAAERLSRSEDPHLKAMAKGFASSLEDMSMEVGMTLAADEG